LTTSKHAFVELVEADIKSAAVFLEALAAVASYRIHTVITDSGNQFVTCRRTAEARPLVSAVTLSRGDALRGIDDRRTGTKHRQALFGTISSRI
jgi:hypothetical protein